MRCRVLRVCPQRWLWLTSERYRPRGRLQPAHDCALRSVREDEPIEDEEGEGEGEEEEERELTPLEKIEELKLLLQDGKIGPHGVSYDPWLFLHMCL